MHALTTLLVTLAASTVTVSAAPVPVSFPGPFWLFVAPGDRYGRIMIENAEKQRRERERAYTNSNNIVQPPSAPAFESVRAQDSPQSGDNPNASSNQPVNRNRQVSTGRRRNLCPTTNIGKFCYNNFGSLTEEAGRNCWIKELSELNCQDAKILNNPQYYWKPPPPPNPKINTESH